MPNVLAGSASMVTEVLNAAIFSTSFTAERSYADWTLPLEENQGDNLLVDVVPVGKIEGEIETRGSIKYSPDVDIAVRLGLGPERRQANGRFNVAEIDELVSLVHEIAEFFAIDRFGNQNQFAWDSERNVKIDIVYAHLRTNHQFTGIVRLPFICSVLIA